MKTCKIAMFPDCRQELYLDLVTIIRHWSEDEAQISIHVHYFKEITPWSKSPLYWKEEQQWKNKSFQMESIFFCVRSAFIEYICVNKKGLSQLRFSICSFHQWSLLTASQPVIVWQSTGRVLLYFSWNTFLAHLLLKFQ